MTALALASLTGCGNQTASSSSTLPETYEEVVAKVASTAAIAYMTNGTTGKNMVTTGNGTNSVPAAGYLLLATSFDVKALVGGAETTVTASIAWTLSDATGWTVADVKSDATHKQYTPKTPAYGKEDLKPVLTGVITFGEATKDVTYDVVVPASTIAPVEFLKLSDLYTSAVTNKKTNVFVVTYGYVTGFASNFGSVYITAGGYGCQLYNATSFSSSFVAGHLLKVTGTITNYYGLELTNVTDVETLTSKEGVDSGDPITPTENDIKAVTGNGTKWDNAFISVNAVYSSYNNGTLKFLVGATPFYVYLKSTIDAAVLAGYKAQFTNSTATGATYNVKGVVSYYATNSLFEVVPWQAGWITALA